MARTRRLTVLRVAAAAATILLLLALPSSGNRFVAQPGPTSAGTPIASQIWWLILAVPLIVHGLAHLSGLIAPFTRRDLGFAEQPWIFAQGGTPHSPIGRVFSVAWLAAALALSASGLGLLFGQSWWAAVALAAAALSLVVILTWWKAVPPGAKVGAAFDLLVLLAALQPTQALISGLAH